VSLSIASEHASLPIAFRLHLPEDWAADPIRRARAGAPEEIRFKTKPWVALDQIRAARAEGVPEGVVLADAGYGNDTKSRNALTRWTCDTSSASNRRFGYGRREWLHWRPWRVADGGGRQPGGSGILCARP